MPAATNADRRLDAVDGYLVDLAARYDRQLADLMLDVDRLSADVRRLADDVDRLERLAGKP
jgi:hypothetical protein